MQTRVVGTQPEIAAPAEATLDARVSIEVRNSSPYNNAMMLGPGDNGGTMLDGNVLVAGSIHAVGGSGVVFSTLNLGAGSAQSNNYDGIDTAFGLGALATKVPTLGTLDINGEVVSSLDAVFRLQNATLTLGGSLGAVDATGNNLKETLDAVWSDDEIVGYVNADVVAGYDLDPTATFPSLSDEYFDETGTPWGSFGYWLQQHSYAFPGGGLEIDYETPSFSYSDVTGKGSISWDIVSQVLTVNGIIRVTDIHFGHDATMAQMPTVYYAGTGAIYSTGDASIHKNLYPAGQYLADGIDDGLEVDGNLGIVVTDDAFFNYGSNDPAEPIIMAAIYAEDSIEFNGVTNVVGAVVTSHLDIDGGPLLIWHVPRLGVIYPSGMPPGRPVSELGGLLADWFQRR